MASYRRSLFVLTVFVLVAASCTKPVLIGSDFLQDEKDSLKFKDNFDLSFFTERTDSVLVHSENVTRQLYTYILGNINDPIFGRYSTEIFAQPILSAVGTQLHHATLDSAVLQLRYDTLGLYGSLNEPVTIEVYRMSENPEFNEEYFSDEKFMSDQLLGSLTFIPRPFDSITVNRPTDTFHFAPGIRIPLSTIIMSELLVVEDTTIFTHQDTFLNYFNGLHIKMTGANNTMLGFNLLNSGSILSFYYDKDNVNDAEFRFIFTTSSIKTVYMEHDYTGSFAEPSLSPDPETDYWFVQGLSGLTTRMTIGGLESLGNAIINQAQLEVYCTFPDGDVPLNYPPIENLITQEPTDTALNNSLDLNIALDQTRGVHNSALFNILYGGALEKITDGPPAVYRYNMKVTNQIKEIYLGEKENIIYFNPIGKANVPNRSVMFGPGHPEFAPRLRIYYTAL